MKALKEKQFYQQTNIGKAKYVVSYYDGEKKHKDGSPFYDIATFKSKNRLKVFLSNLKKQNYTEV